MAIPPHDQQSQLHLPWLGNDGLPLITMQQGTIRFWYRPEWSSKTLEGLVQKILAAFWNSEDPLQTHHWVGGRFI